MNVDDTIRKAVNGERFEEESIIVEALSVLRGRNAWLNWVSAVFAFAFFGVQVFAGYKVYVITDASERVFWAVVFMFAAMAVGMLKLWWWLVVNRNAVIREVKRLELEVARLRESRA